MIKVSKGLLGEEELAEVRSAFEYGYFGLTAKTDQFEDHVKILAYSVNRARTEGNGVEGSLVHVKYTLADGASLPENISFHFFRIIYNFFEKS